MNTKEEVFSTLQTLGCDPEVFFTKIRSKGEMPSKEDYDKLPFFWELFKDKDLNDKEVQYDMKQLSMEAYDLCCDLWIQLINKLHNCNFNDNNKDSIYATACFDRIKKIIKSKNLYDLEEFISFKKKYKQLKKTSVKLVTSCKSFTTKWDEQKIDISNYDKIKDHMNEIKEYYFSVYQDINREYKNMYDSMITKLYELEPPDYN